MQKAGVRSLLSPLLGLAVLLAPACAKACRGENPLDRQIAAWYESGTIDTVAIVEVTQLNTQSDTVGGMASSGRVVAIVSGEPLPTRFAFKPDLIIVGCGWTGNIQTRVGEFLTVYLRRKPDGEREYFSVIPLAWAIIDDQRVASFARENGLEGNSDFRNEITLGFTKIRRPAFEPVPTPDLREAEN